MKKFIVTIALTLFCVTCFAQERVLAAYFPETDTGYILDKGMRFPTLAAEQIAKHPCEFYIIDADTKKEVYGYYFERALNNLIDDLNVLQNLDFTVGGKKYRETIKAYNFYYGWRTRMRYAKQEREVNEKELREQRELEERTFHLGTN